MDAFEYVMVLISIIVGLAITHVLNALAAAVHRLRGHGDPLRLEAVYLLWIGFVTTWLVSFWWWEFKFQEVTVDWSFGLYLFLITYAVSLFLVAAVLVVGAPVASAKLVLDTLDSFLKSAEWGMRPIFLAQSAFNLGAAVVGIASERRGVQLACASVAFAVQMVYMFQEVGVLGAW